MGIYFSLESECWAIGFLIGLVVLCWALDHPNRVGTNFWLILISSVGVAGVILLFLKHRMTAATDTAVSDLAG